jgi:hypothetical protein
MKKISLTQGKFALVSDSDYWLVQQFKWCASKRGHNWYAETAVKAYGKRRQFHMTMHQLICGFPPFDIDHKNRNGLDNCRRNLRPATPGQNNHNCRLPSTNSSGKRGVYFKQQNKKWCAQISYKNNKIYLGLFATLKSAHAAYVKAAASMYGEYAAVS